MNSEINKIKDTKLATPRQGCSAVRAFAQLLQVVAQFAVSSLNVDHDWEGCADAGILLHVIKIELSDLRLDGPSLIPENRFTDALIFSKSL